MKLLENLSFSARLIGLLLVPLIAFMLTTSYLVYSSVSEKERINQIKLLPDFSVFASALVHELQIERGLSAGYLGSNGAKFGSQLSSHTANTDKRLEEFNDYIAGNDLSIFHSSVTPTLDEIKFELGRIKSVRNRIQQQSLSLKEGVDYFTNINARLLSLIVTISIKSSNMEISRLAMGSANFMHAKEVAGIIRAVLTGTFAADQFAPGMRDKFITLAAKQEIFFKDFSRFADNKSVELYKKYASSPLFIETARMRKAALLNSGESFDVDAGYWFKQQTNKINKLKLIEDQLTQTTVAKMEQLSAVATRQIWVKSLTGIAVTLFTILMSSALIRRLSRESACMTDALEKISAGELSAEGYDYSTPAFIALESMQRKLISVNNSIGNVTYTVRTSSAEIAQSNTALAQRAEEQGRNLESTAASMEQISSTVRLNAENLQEGNDLSTKARKHASNGQEIVKQAVSAMNEINQNSDKIEEIINVIDEIAFQTNLLALNAAVEAARAGEQGRGFAVVAAEVGNLAKRSSKAAQEIKSIIEESVNNVDCGNKLVAESGKSLEEIVDAVSDVNKVISEVTHAGEEQAIGVGQIGESIVKLDEVNQQNTVMVEEVAVSSRILEEQAKELEDLISFYSVAGQPRTQTKAEGHPDKRSSNRPWSETKRSEKNPTQDAASSSYSDDEAWESFG